MTPIGSYDGDDVRIKGVNVDTGEDLAYKVTDDGHMPMGADETNGFVPDPANMTTGHNCLNVDIVGNLQTRGAVLTDEGGLRDEFSGDSLTTTLTGTFTFTNGSDVVTSSGANLVDEAATSKFIKCTSHAESAWARVYRIGEDATELYLDNPYTGATVTGSAHISNWETSTPAGASLAVTNSALVISAPTTTTTYTGVFREGDFPPVNMVFRVKINQRVANQRFSIGMVDNALTLTPSKGARIRFDGTSTGSFKCVSSGGSTEATEWETTTVTPGGTYSSADYHNYEVDIRPDKVAYLLDGKVVALHTTHIPGPYDIMTSQCLIKNTGTAAAGTVAYVDTVYFGNVNVIETTNTFLGEPMKVQLVGKSVITGLPVDAQVDAYGNLVTASPTTSAGESDVGYVTTAALTQVPIRPTTYTEQTTNSQMSIASGSANDTSAGTGARTVLLEYYDQNMNGPYSETITLNGTSYVNTAATNICYIEHIEVITAGSGGTNAGILTLKASTGGGGATVVTVPAGDTQWLTAHHYIPAGKTAFFTGVSVSHNGTTVGSGGVFVLKRRALGSTVELQVSDYTRLYGQSSSVSRVFQAPPRIVGPARITMYVSPESTSSTVFRASFDYYEQAGA